MLVAISAVHELGYELSAFEIMANLFYPGMLLVSSLILSSFMPDRKNAEKQCLKSSVSESTQKIMLKCPTVFHFFGLIGGHFLLFLAKIAKIAVTFTVEILLCG